MKDRYYPPSLEQVDGPSIHPTTTIWHPELCNIYGNCKIGAGCNIGCFVEIGPDVFIGDKVRIGAHCFIPAGVTIENGCFIGPGVVFTNDKYPPGDKSLWQKIIVKSGASIGARATILPGVEIGSNTLIGAGSVITRSIPAGWRVAGNPAKRIIVSAYSLKNGIEK